MDVSVICPVFNTPPAVVAAAVRSVLGQAGPHALELILVDDCSTDPATIEALRDAAGGDGRVRVFHQDRNTGPSQARVVGIGHATHDWIGFVDSDDLWPEGKLDQAAAVQREWTDTRWIGGSFATLLPDGTLQPGRSVTADCPSAEAGRTAQRLRTPDSTRMLVGAWHPLGTSLVRKDLIAAAGGFDPSLLYGEDWLLFLRMSALAPLDYIEADTYVLRRQGASLTRSPWRLTNKAVHSLRLARRDPALRPARQQLRWCGYTTYKDIAMNNALNGHKLRGLGFALLALTVDPREVRELLLFLRLLRTTGPTLAGGLKRYSTADQVELSNVANQTKGAV